MKKIFIITGMVISLIMPNLALAVLSQDQKVVKSPELQQTEYPEIIKLLKKQIDVNKRQLVYAERIYQSLKHDKFTRNYIAANYSNIFIKDPESIYDENKRSNGQYTQILENEKKLSGNFSQMNKAIFARLQHTTSVDKAVTLQTFETVENRFKYILSLLDALSKADSVKEIFDVQTIVEGTLTMIKNESIKLQMVAHLRDAEHKLIKTKKREIDMKVFSSTNKDMPRIRFN
ncbi:type IV secretion system protein [Bartonella sp. TT121SHDZB]|uniref:type IV secretion system protein n=1 Tax=Bartonella sp. TT121SHDZB TaxID=3243580 RepID=UPI0035CF5FCC